MERTWKATTAGILNIISGAFFLLGGITIFSLLGQPAMATTWAGYAMYSLEISGTPSSSFVTTFIVIMGTVVTVPGVVSILGGVYSMKRSVWGLALAGSISTFLSIRISKLLPIPLCVVLSLELSIVYMHRNYVRLHHSNPTQSLHFNFPNKLLWLSLFFL